MYVKYLSVFSGIGGFELGIGEKGECVGFSEINPYATKIYRQHFPNHPELGDITKIDPAKLPDFDLLVGGFPCQAFSVAGKRRGFADTRGTLFFEIARILAIKKPRLLLLENVKGLISHDKQNTFRVILQTLDELGYDLQWQVLNSKNHGVPQNRERVYIVGHLRGTRRPQVFPFVGDCTKTSVGIRRIAHMQGFRRYNQTYEKDGVVEALDTAQGGGHQPCIAIPVMTPDRIEKRQNGRRFKTDGEPSFILTAQDKHGVYDGSHIRRLTPLECERLQGFPDNWTQGVSDSQRYKCLGNAVTVNVIRGITELLLF